MKKWITGIIVLAAAVLIFTGCSQDGVTLAKYNDGKKGYAVKIGQVKKDAFTYLSYNPLIVGNTNWHQDFIFSQYIFPELVYLEEMSQGMTNSPKYKEVVGNELKKMELSKLYTKGVEIFTNSAKKEKFDIVRVSHILVLANKYTNINGKSVEIPAVDYEKILAEKENIARNILDSLKASKNLDKDFSNIAATRSEDSGSAAEGGDVGYFLKGFMVKEFEDASFNTKNKGLIGEPVKTSYGYHIIYVTDSAKKHTMNEIEKLMGKEKYQQLAPYFQKSYQDEQAKTAIKSYYSIDTNKKTVLVDGKGFSIKDMPETSKLFDVMGNTYDWKALKDIITLFNPNFESTLSNGQFTVDMFDGNVKSLENNMMLVEIAKKANVDKTSAYIKDFEKSKKDLDKQIATYIFQESFMRNLEQQISADDVAKEYNSNRTNYTKDAAGKKISNLKEAESQVRQNLSKTMVENAYNVWKAGIYKKYKVDFSTSGLQTLGKLEADKLKQDHAEQLKAAAAQMKSAQPAK